MSHRTEHPEWFENEAEDAAEIAAANYTELEYMLASLLYQESHHYEDWGNLDLIDIPPALQQEFLYHARLELPALRQQAFIDLVRVLRPELQDIGQHAAAAYLTHRVKFMSYGVKLS